MSHLRRQVASFRRLVETTYAGQRGGEIGIAAASRIATACVAIRQAARCERILAKAGEPGKPDGLTHEQWLSYSDRVLRYREAADRALTALGLDASPKPANPWDGYYSQPFIPAQLPEPENVQQPTSAPDAPNCEPGALEGIPTEGNP